MRPQKTLCASLFAAGLTLPLASAAQADVVIAIDKSTQHMTVSVDGSERYSWPVSTGRPGYDTPNGTFKPNRMDADHFSQEWDNAPMPHTIFFDTRGHAVHGFSDVKHLGLAVSHGCVRLAPPNAAVLFSLVKAEGMANTSVVISGHTPGGNGQEIARRTPSQQAAYSPAPGPGPTRIAPSYGQQRVYSPPGYGAYGQSTFPPQPAPSYGRPVSGGQSYDGGQAYYDGQSYYSGQTYDAQPYSGYGYQQYRPYSPY